MMSVSYTPRLKLLAHSLVGFHNLVFLGKSFEVTNKPPLGPLPNAMPTLLVTLLQSQASVSMESKML
jgi:hypothetical protein